LTTYETNKLTLRLGWIHDVIDYARGNFNNPSHSETDRLISRIEREFNHPYRNGNLSLRLGGEWSHYRTQVDGYGDQPIQEDRADLYALLRLQFSRWLVSANLRQAFVTRFDPPITPSVGAEFLVLKTAKSNLTAKGSVARSYRVPTLNERYWKVLGNPDIRPENGFNLEAGLAGRWFPSEKLTISTEATVFRNRIDDWSYWNPDYGYRVENLQLVVARGLEWSGSVNHTSANWQSGLTLGYALTRSSQERVYNVYAQDIIGKQLVYVPQHSGRFSAYLAHGKTASRYKPQASSRRYITFDNIQFLRGYLLTNVLLETQVKLGPIESRIQGQINNVFNTVYLNVKRNAMPGRNFAIQLICNLNTKKQ
jgi:vitamin B12 transporter